MENGDDDYDFRDDISTLSQQEPDDEGIISLGRPDEPMSRVVLSLKEYNREVSQILTGTATGFPPMERSDRVDAFVLANLCGRFCIDNLNEGFGRENMIEGNLRVSLDALHDVPQANANRVTITRDCDSLIGRTFDLPYDKSIAVYPLPRFEDVLKKTNHMIIKIRSQVSRQAWHSPLYH